MLEGFDTSGLREHRLYTITSGRDTIWPAALQGIAQNPWVGYGRYGYVISKALDESLATGGGEKHPHNAFLEAALDHGIFGAALILGPLVYVLVAGMILVLRRSDPLLRWAGFAGVSTAVTALVAGFGGQHFVLYENYWVFWCTCGLVVRATTLPDRSPTRLPRGEGDATVLRRQAPLDRW